ncbi:Na+/melibiose symporter-like transporter [Microterricola gilva]|uniref:Na+/melibiose symporter-like transporter n=1 Tax=Microterricola gilva TaxID=393267 RepID=A0A4Q8ARD0_9MICO|nr:MFS transporter [Microterricola gilva]RZU66655.1 Na+/melibiose symporter-like transporter [Microterricola gilva]
MTRDEATTGSEPTATELLFIENPDPRDLPRVAGRSVLAYLAAYLGAFLLFVVPLATALALKVAELTPDARETTLGIIMGVGALIAMFANPVFGALSDRTTSRFGMRRPWILGGAIVAVAAAAVLGFAGEIVLVGAAWTVVQLSINAVLAGLAAFIPDRVPEQQRGKVAAWTGISTQIAPLVALLIGNIAFGIGGGIGWMILTPALVGLVLIAVFVYTVKDRILEPGTIPRLRLRQLFSIFVFNPRSNPDFGWAWLGRFLITLSFAAANTYMVYFMNARLGVPLAQVAVLQLTFLVGTTILIAASATISGAISDRLRRRKGFVLAASGLIALHHVIVAFTFDWPLYIVALAISAIAMGVYFSVDLALVTEVLPDTQNAAAQDMGIFNIANALPQSLAPALAPLALAIGGSGSNYTALYLIAAAVAIAGALTVLPIKAVR